MILIFFFIFLGGVPPPPKKNPLKRTCFLLTLAENHQISTKYFEIRRKCEHLEEDKNAARSIAHRQERRIAELMEENGRHLEEIQRLGTVHRELEFKQEQITGEKELEEINSTILERANARLETEKQEEQVRAANAEGQCAILTQQLLGTLQQVGTLQEKLVCFIFRISVYYFFLGGGGYPPKKIHTSITLTYLGVATATARGAKLCRAN